MMATMAVLILAFFLVFEVFGDLSVDLVDSVGRPTQHLPSMFLLLKSREANSYLCNTEKYIRSNNVHPTT